MNDEPEKTDPSREPPPTRRGARRPWRIALVALAAALLTLAGAGWALSHWSRKPIGERGVVELTVPRGASLRETAAALRRSGLIDSERAFAALAIVRRRARNLQAGDYEFALPVSPEQVLDRLGRGAFERRLVVPEGWTSKRIAARLVEQGWIASESDWLNLTASPVGDRAFGETIAEGAEGFCFPDTYRLEVGDGAERILDRMLKRFAEVWRRAEPERREARSAGLTAREVVTLASMIEREARSAAEMPRIASVYLNRLRIGMKLQCCATVHFALGEVWDRALTLEDLKIDSPYNTYVVAGLPAGPIGNPGRPAIEAVLRPAETDDLFYVYRGDGTHEFTKTYADHLKAVKRFSEADPTAELVSTVPPDA